jgi:hypothetical protein
MLDFSRCRDVWVPDESEAGGFWSPPPAHVRYGVEQILAHPYFLLADDMGGMKTAQAIIAAQFLFAQGTIDRVIVIATAAIRSKVWFDKDLGQLIEQVWHDTRNVVSEYHQKIKSWAHGPEDQPPLKWIVTNYELIRAKNHLAVILPYCGPKTFLILDESSAVRSHSSKQTEACMLLRWKSKKNRKGVEIPIHGAARCGRILELNGTPVAESPLDMFSQGNLLHPSVLDCRYITLYKSRYAIQEKVLSTHKKDAQGNALPLLDQWNRPILTIKAGEEGWTNLADLQRRFAPHVLRREAKDFGIDFALPPVGFDVPLTETTWRMYNDMRKELVVWLQTGVVTAAQAGVKAIRLAQITSGFIGGIEDSGLDDGRMPYDHTATCPAMHNGHGIGTFACDCGADVVRQTMDGPPPLTIEIGREKLDFALAWQAELLKHDPNLKLLSWMRFVPELRRYLAEVKKFGHEVGAACGEAVLGGRMKDERENALRLLHPKTAPEGAVTVGATQGTGAMGLNFTACHTVMDISYDASPWKKRQGDARVNRTGQTRPVNFFYLTATGPKGQRTIDTHLMLLRLNKMRVADLTVSGWVKMLEEE